ncbi:MAG TPA: hypothetical protein VG166_09130 [Caulobacteraceae bacterium]|jgi:hypothetical protein|nr:hypothetical protein [Caulobacteraceae bacterium]
MNGVAVFNVTAAVVMGALGMGALILDPGAAHDVCLAVVSGLTGALAGAGASRLSDKIPSNSGSGAVSPENPQQQ